jgi:hypothetical protein
MQNLHEKANFKIGKLHEKASFEMKNLHEKTLFGKVSKSGLLYIDTNISIYQYSIAHFFLLMVSSNCPNGIGDRYERRENREQR